MDRQPFLKAAQDRVERAPDKISTLGPNPNSATYCVTSDKQLNCSELRFSICKLGTEIANYPTRFL